MYLEAELPTAKEKETMRVDMDTKRGHLCKKKNELVVWYPIIQFVKPTNNTYGLKFRMESDTRNRRKVTK